MKVKSSFLSEYYRLLDLVEDYFRDGFRQPHPQPELVGQNEPSPRSPSSPQDPADRLAAVAREVAVCRKCALHRGRKSTVPGEGVPHPMVLVVGEGPGADEDLTGRPFVGKAGQYLDKWLKAIELDRSSNCFIANIVKCRPPGNRDPLPEESSACLPYLKRQIEILQPRVILAVGRIAAQILSGQAAGIGELRGKSFSCGSIPVVATYHPSAVLRDPSLRAPVWEDLKRLRSLLGNV